MTNGQASEVLKMVTASVCKRFAWLQEADRQDLAGNAWEQVYKFHKPTKKLPNPNFRFCDCFVKSQAIKKGYISPNRSNGGNYIFGMTTDRQLVSCDELFETTGWEPSVPCIETMIIARSERTANERMVQCYLENPWQSAKIKSAIEHIKNGGNLKNFAVGIGMSGQSLKNVMKRSIHHVHQTKQQFLPLI